MKKYLLILTAIFLCGNANAQMADVLGSMAVDGALTQGSYQGVGQMRQALGRVQFQQDLAMLNTQIQTMFMGNYTGLSKDILNFEGLQGVTWNVGPAAGGQYYIELDNLDGQTCFACKNPEWNARKVEINGGADCRSTGNKVKMYF